MLGRVSTGCLQQVAKRQISTTAKNHNKVAVLGGSGGIGQPLSLLLKQSPLISHLSVYDVQHAPGVAADLSHIETRAKVTGHDGPQELRGALEGSDIVIIPAGVPRKPGMTRDDLFNTNASIVRDLVDAAAKHCPRAMIGIVTNPVNSTVPIACKVLEKHNVFDPKRVFGITSLDIVRANTFIAEAMKADVSTVDVPVIGGHSGVTIIPLLSQATPAVNLSAEERRALTVRIQNAGTEVVEAKAGAVHKYSVGIQNAGTEVGEAKAGAGSATLSMAFAAYRFATSLMEAMGGAQNKVECAYVLSTETEAKFFSTPLVLGKNGVERNMGLGELDEYERGLLEAAMPELQSNIRKGEDFQ